jgi:hypothetical protein
MDSLGNVLEEILIDLHHEMKNAEGNEIVFPS